MRRCPTKNMAKNDEGVTLVEILIASTLLVVVLGLGYSLFFFGTNAFSRGETHSIVQQNARMAADYVIGSVRYAKDLEIRDSDDLDELSSYQRILYSQNGQLFTTHESQEEAAFGLEDDIDLMIRFQKLSDDELELIITARQENTEYTLDTSITLVNIDKGPKSNKIEDESNPSGERHAVGFDIP